MNNKKIDVIALMEMEYNDFADFVIAFMVTHSLGIKEMSKITEVSHQALRSLLRKDRKDIKFILRSKIINGCNKIQNLK